MAGPVELETPGLAQIDEAQAAQLQQDGSLDKEITSNAEVIPDVWIGVALFVGGAIWMARQAFSHKGNPNT